MKKILVVDDQVHMAGVIVSIFEDDYDVTTAANGELGIKKAIEFKPDLIFMDVMMPVKDGITAIRELRAMDEFKETPIFIVTAKGEIESETLINELHINGVITKPFMAVEVLEMVNEILQ